MNSDSPRVRVRYAPSPTGFLHIGGLRTALYNELFARRHGGDFVLRIEDTDRTRLVPGAIEDICQSLLKCGVVPDEGVWIDDDSNVIQKGEHGPYIQSERRERHTAYAKTLIEKGKAYYCFCSAERLANLRAEQEARHVPTMYDGLCRALTSEEATQKIAAGESRVVRLRLPRESSITFHDLIRGEIRFEWNLIDDQVILKSDGFPTYHLAAMCDDHDMAITHVVRGEEWLSSTPKHLFIYEAFGWKPPQFAHLPLLLNPDRSKLSKRQGDVAVEDYLTKGFLPEVLINFVALLGWNPTSDREIFSHQELRELFDLEKVNKAGAVFNLEKLEWLNAHYLRTMEPQRYLELTRPFVAVKNSETASKIDSEFVDRVLLLVRDRVTKPQDVEGLTEFFFAAQLSYENVALTWKQQTADETLLRLREVASLLERLDKKELGMVANVEEKIKRLIAEKEWGNGDTLWPLRVALSGQEKSPGPFELIVAYGKERSLKRIGDAILFLESKR